MEVVAVGARTPLGLRAAPSLAALRARVSRVADHPFFVDVRGEPIRTAYDHELGPGVAGFDRMIALARTALAEIGEQLGPAATAGGPIPLSLALPAPRPGFTKEDAGRLLAELVKGSKFTSAANATYTMLGHAGGLLALQAAAEKIASRSADLFIVGGVDSYLHSDTLLDLESRGLLAVTKTRSGFPPGEAACFLLLASRHARTALRLPLLGTVTGVGSGQQRPGAGPAMAGRALAQAIRAASGPPDRAAPFDEIYCDINGERARTEEWGFALLRTRELWRDPSAYQTPIAECGDVGAASGPLLAALALWAGQRGFLKGPRAIVWAASQTGQRAAAAIERAPASSTSAK